MSATPRALPPPPPPRWDEENETGEKAQKETGEEKGEETEAGAVRARALETRSSTAMQTLALQTGRS